MYRYRQDKRGIVGAINKVKQYFGIEGYTLVEEHDHGLPNVRLYIIGTNTVLAGAFHKIISTSTNWLFPICVKTIWHTHFRSCYLKEKMLKFREICMVR